MSQHAFIIGGAGQNGRAVADRLLGNGWNVTVSHRGHRALSDDLIARAARLAVLDRKQPGAARMSSSTPSSMRQIMPISCSRSSPASVRSLSFHRPASIAIRQAARLTRRARAGFRTFRRRSSMLPKTRCSNAALRLHLQQRRHEAAAQRLRRIRCTGGAADPARRILRILIDGFLE